jgi:hypothetical protein
MRDHSPTSGTPSRARTDSPLGRHGTRTQRFRDRRKSEALDEVSELPQLAAIFGDPNSSDPVAAARAPDVFIQPDWRTIYSGSSSKIAEDGGGTLDDTHVALLISLSGFGAGQVISEAVTTTQVAPTILRALRLDPAALQGVRKEGTKVLPGLF